MSPRPDRQRPGTQSSLIRRPEPIRTGGADPAEAPAVHAPDPDALALRSPVAEGERYPHADYAAPPRQAGDGDLDDETLNHWRWRLGATARKAVAARDRADAAMVAWERLAGDAARAGVPERLVVAAAADAGIHAPM